MQAIYDKIGDGYSIGRRTDPTVASNIYQFLSESDSIVNIGAGSGSYEPEGKTVIAIEPSIKMIDQRQNNAYPVVQAFAESLPFEDASFTHAMTVLSMHHWSDREAAFNEIKRVTTKRFVAVTWNPDSPPFWLTEEYFPEIYEIDQSVFPSLNELTWAFPGVRFFPLEIPATCIDGFTAAFWSRPQAYLDPNVRIGMSTFGKIANVASGLTKLSLDLQSGQWRKNNQHLQRLKTLDVGYTIAVWDV